MSRLATPLSFGLQFHARTGTKWKNTVKDLFADLLADMALDMRKPNGASGTPVKLATAFLSQFRQFPAILTRHLFFDSV
jgi:hypothetical protein